MWYYCSSCVLFSRSLKVSITALTLLCEYVNNGHFVPCCLLFIRSVLLWILRSVSFIL